VGRATLKPCGGGGTQRGTRVCSSRRSDSPARRRGRCFRRVNAMPSRTKSGANASRGPAAGVARPCDLHNRSVSVSGLAHRKEPGWCLSLTVENQRENAEIIPDLHRHHRHGRVAVSMSLVSGSAPLPKSRRNKKPFKSPSLDGIRVSTQTHHRLRSTATGVSVADILESWHPWQCPQADRLPGRVQQGTPTGRWKPPTWRARRPRRAAAVHRRRGGRRGPDSVGGLPVAGPDGKEEHDPFHVQTGLR
jgi:hypothetical protein